MGLPFTVLTTALSAASAIKSLTAKAPKTSSAPTTQLENDQKAQTPSAAYATEGGAAGQDLNADQVKRRNTIFGN